MIDTNIFEPNNQANNRPSVGDGGNIPSESTNPGPLADNRPAVRPGVSNRTLRQNGITETGLGSDGTWGLRIPYFGFDGSEQGRKPICDESDPDVEFCRERLANPRGDQKYTQPAGTSAHIYFPDGLCELIRDNGYLIVTEGEFKALALVEGGYPAIGLGGFFNFQRDGELLPGFVDFFDDMARPGMEVTTLYFLGDADTAINPAFSRAAVKFREMVESYSIPVRLPRMPVAEMLNSKGIDDARNGMDCGQFREYMDGLLADSLELTHEWTAEDLAEELFNREEDSLRELISRAPDKNPWFLRRLADLANGVAPVMASELADFAVDTGLVRKLSLFKAEQKKQKEKAKRKMAEM